MCLFTVFFSQGYDLWICFSHICFQFPGSTLLSCKMQQPDFIFSWSHQMSWGNWEHNSFLCNEGMFWAVPFKDIMDIETFSFYSSRDSRTQSKTISKGQFKVVFIRSEKSTFKNRRKSLAGFGEQEWTVLLWTETCSGSKSGIRTKWSLVTISRGRTFCIQEQERDVWDSGFN